MAGQGDHEQSAKALEKLARLYWYPLYTFARRQSNDAETAKDLTQGFFAHLLEKRLIARADPAAGRFRSFLLASFKNYIGQERLKATAQKRGGGVPLVALDDETAEDRYRLEPVDARSPEVLFERRWAVTLIETVLTRLEAECQQGGKVGHFAEMKPFLLGDRGTISHAELGARLGLSEGAARVAVHRLRQRYRELFREEVAQTVTNPAELEEELRHIFAILAS
jgi:RNA polymerase sigma-70 factor (ECF subfamily)